MCICNFKNLGKNLRHYFVSILRDTVHRLNLMFLTFDFRKFHYDPDFAARRHLVSVECLCPEYWLLSAEHNTTRVPYRYEFSSIGTKVF